MDRALVGDLEQPGTLLLRKFAGDRDLALDPIEHALCGFTFGAVVGVDPRMAQANRHAADRPPFPSRIQRDRHGRSGAEARQQQIVRPEPPVGPSGGDRLVGDQAVTPCGDLLDESVPPATHDHDGLLVWIDHAGPPVCGKAWIAANGQGQNRTADTRIFSPLLYQLSYLAEGRETSSAPITFASGSVNGLLTPPAHSGTHSGSHPRSHAARSLYGPAFARISTPCSVCHQSLEWT